jgi:hypothetical protein
MGIWRGKSPGFPQEIPQGARQKAPRECAGEVMGIEGMGKMERVAAGGKERAEVWHQDTLFTDAVQAGVELSGTDGLFPPNIQPVSPPCPHQIFPLPSAGVSHPGFLLQTSNKPSRWRAWSEIPCR